jgi:hypothetical protein
MNSKQIFMMVAIIAALSAAMIATPVMAQNVTGGNMTGGNMNGKVCSFMPPETRCPVSAEGIPDESCLQDKSQYEGQDESQGEGQGEDEDEDEDEEEGGN